MDEQEIHYVIAERQVFVENALHARVIDQPGVPGGIQKQYLNRDGSIWHVQPGTLMEKKMFDLLCMPDTEWPVHDD